MPRSLIGFERQFKRSARTAAWDICRRGSLPGALERSGRLRLPASCNARKEGRQKPCPQENLPSYHPARGNVGQVKQISVSYDPVRGGRGSSLAASETSSANGQPAQSETPRERIELPIAIFLSYFQLDRESLLKRPFRGFPFVILRRTAIDSSEILLGKA